MCLWLCILNSFGSVWWLFVFNFKIWFWFWFWIWFLWRILFCFWIEMIHLLHDTQKKKAQTDSIQSYHERWRQYIPKQWLPMQTQQATPLNLFSWSVCVCMRECVSKWMFLSSYWLSEFFPATLISVKEKYLFLFFKMEILSRV